MSKADETCSRTVDKIRDKHECFKVDSYDCWVKNRLDQKRAEARK